MQIKIYKTLFFFILFTSCQYKNTHYRKTQDSLIAILHHQLNTLQNLPKLEKMHFTLSDSLSTLDSALYQNLFMNYQKAITTIDSIQIILKFTYAEYDTLLHDSSNQIPDTSVIKRLLYLTDIHQQYIQEYCKSLSIIEQNASLLKALSRHAK